MQYRLALDNLIRRISTARCDATRRRTHATVYRFKIIGRPTWAKYRTIHMIKFDRHCAPHLHNAQSIDSLLCNGFVLSFFLWIVIFIFRVKWETKTGKTGWAFFLFFKEMTNQNGWERLNNKIGTQLQLQLFSLFPFPRLFREQATMRRKCRTLDLLSTLRSGAEIQGLLLPPSAAPPSGRPWEQSCRQRIGDDNVDEVARKKKSRKERKRERESEWTSNCCNPWLESWNNKAESYKALENEPRASERVISLSVCMYVSLNHNIADTLFFYNFFFPSWCFHFLHIYSIFLSF